jgi:hypothetical protein
MSQAVRYGDRKDQIRKILEACARKRETIFYSDLGPQVRIPQTGPWKPVLDLISLEERAAGRPDITYLVISKTSGLPAQIEFEEAKPPRPDQRKIADEVIQAVFKFYI